MPSRLPLPARIRALIAREADHETAAWLQQSSALAQPVGNSDLVGSVDTGCGERIERDQFLKASIGPRPGHFAEIVLDIQPDGRSRESVVHESSARECIRAELESLANRWRHDWGEKIRVASHPVFDTGLSVLPPIGRGVKSNLLSM
jgi:hypothetical protein